MVIISKKIKKVHVLHIAKISHIDKQGNILWEAKNLDNILHDEGEQALLSAYFATTMSGFGSPPASIYLGLDARGSVVEADTLANLSGEPTTKIGYERKALSTAGTGANGQDFYINQPAAYYRADGKTVIYTAGEDWTAVTQLFLCTVLSGTAGKLIATVALSASRTLLSGDSLNASMYIGLSE